MKFTVKSIRIGSYKKIVTDLNKLLENPTIKAKFDKTENSMHNDWIMKCKRNFNVRANSGFRCDQFLEQSLDLVIRKKNTFVMYVKPISRKTKGTNSSGGPVRNLTSILFVTGASSSDATSENWAGKYYPKWDCRVQTGRHPGIKVSIGRNMWKNFTREWQPKIRRALHDGVAEVVKKSCRR